MVKAGGGISHEVGSHEPTRVWFVVCGEGSNRIAVRAGAEVFDRASGSRVAGVTPLRKI